MTSLLTVLASTRAIYLFDGRQKRRNGQVSEPGAGIWGIGSSGHAGRPCAQEVRVFIEGLLTCWWVEEPMRLDLITVWEEEGSDGFRVLHHGSGHAFVAPPQTVGVGDATRGRANVDALPHTDRLEKG
jgi:hypothetical protein